jgi:nucleotide-binding universal stress UspA family protein
MLIVCGIDRSAAAAEAARRAADLARELRGDVLFVHVVEGVAIPAAVPAHLHAPVRAAAIERAEEAVVEWLRQEGLGDRQWLVTEGDPAAELVDVAAQRGAALLVVGSRALGPWRSAVLGSVSAEVARRASCPVMIVPGTDSRRSTHEDPARAMLASGR